MIQCEDNKHGKTVPESIAVVLEHMIAGFVALATPICVRNARLCAEDNEDFISQFKEAFENGDDNNNKSI